MQIEKLYPLITFDAGRQAAERSVMQYFTEAASDLEQDAWRSANLDSALDGRDLCADLGRM